MDYTHLGRSGLSVSRLCLGTMNFGPQTPEDDSHAIMDAAHEHGINFFDTANRYGGELGAGATESILGRWFATMPAGALHALIAGGGAVVSSRWSTTYLAWSYSSARLGTARRASLALPPTVSASLSATASAAATP